MPKGVYIRRNTENLRHPVRLTEKNVLEIKSRLNAGESHASIAKDFGVVRTHISLIFKERVWRHIGHIDQGVLRTQCKQCSTQFIRKYSSHKFCSAKCKDKWAGTFRAVPTDPTSKAFWNYKSRMLRKWGLTLGQFDELLRKQGGRCAICRKEPIDKRYNRFAVDHNHATGEIRGLLCRACNTALGFFNDDVNLLMAAIAYLEKGWQYRASVRSSCVKEPIASPVRKGA